MDTVSTSGRRVRKFEGLAAVVATVVSSFLIGAAPAQDVAAAANVIPDDALRACVTDAMASDNVTPQQPGIITAGDLENAVSANVQNLYCSDKDVKSLEGLSGLTSLTNLHLNSNQISDLSPLAGLSSLISLGVENNQISDLEPLAGLSNLWQLGLNDNQISDLEPLAGLSNLWDLNLENNQVSDLEPLAGLSSLYDLNLENNQVSDLEPLAGLSSLGVLGLDDNQVSDLGPLAGLSNLSQLYLYDNQVSDLSPLAGLSNLGILYLNHNQISDLKPLAGLSNLWDLELSDNQVSDLEPLAGLSNLAGLSLDRNQVSDLSPLAGLSNLSALDLSGNQISDLKPLAGLANLTYLDLTNNQISDVSPLAGLLAWLSEPIESTTPWNTDQAVMPIVFLSGNEITDASVLPEGFRFVFGEGGSQGVLLTDQWASASAVAGAVVPLPAVQTRSQYEPIVWSVVSGSATINDDGTVVYPQAGSVVLAWHDASPYRYTIENWDNSEDCFADGGQVVTFRDAGVQSWCEVPDFSGQVTVTVSASSTPSVSTPSVPDSSVAKNTVKASTTGGAARLADGKDSYTLVTTVVDDNGTPLVGLADRLTAQAPDGVIVGSFTDNGDGTYSVKVTSADPGNYQIVVLLDGKPVGDPVPVNFIGADIAQASRVAGEQQSADGLGFLPGEKVTVTVHSDPIDLGTLTADENGKVSVSFEVLASLEAGDHSVEFAGAVSGTVSVAFNVTTPSGATPAGTTPAGTTPTGTTPTVDVNTGGTVAPDTGLLVGLVACLMVAGVALGTTARLRLRHRPEA